MGKRFSHVIFDFDGTLVDTGPGISASIQAALDHVGAARSFVLETVIGPPLPVIFMDVLGLEEEKAGKAMEFYRDHYGREGRLSSELYPGVRELLAELTAQGITCHIASSKSEKDVKELLKFFGVDGYFTGLCGARPGQNSTKAETIRELMEGQGISDSEAVMVGDRFYDVDGAAEVGIPVIGVLYGFAQAGELEVLPTLALAADVNTLRELLL